MTNLIKSDRLIYSMSSENKPALEVEPGSTVVFETCDCFQNQISSSE